MGLPIWNSPPPSPRPSNATLCEGQSRSTIRRRVSPRTSPREGAHRFAPISRNSRSFTYYGSRNRVSIDLSESQRSEIVAQRLSSLNENLNDLQEHALRLRNQHRRIVEMHSRPQSARGERLSPADIPNDYGVPVEDELHDATEDELYMHIPLDARYERSINSYQGRLLRTRHEIQRLESDGLQLSEQRQRLTRLHAEFYNRHLPYSDLVSQGAHLDEARSRDDSEPVPHVLSVPDRFTSSPQPMAEAISRGAVRETSTRSSSSSGPEMELPPLRRMGHRDVGDRSPERPTIYREMDHSSPGPFRRMRAYTVEEILDELHDGLGDRERSVESEPAEEENWNTMLTSITPDERLPSASSSFASEEAARSFSAGSNSSSRAASAFGSAGTSITVPEDDSCNTEEVWRSIGDRFHRGEEVSEEMWANAGVPAHTARIISRSMRERL